MMNYFRAGGNQAVVPQSSDTRTLIHLTTPNVLPRVRLRQSPRITLSGKLVLSGTRKDSPRPLQTVLIKVPVSQTRTVAVIFPQ